MTTTAYRRFAGASIAMIGALGLAACNGDTVTATPPATSAAAQDQATTQAPEATTSEAPSTSESPSTTSDASSDAASGGGSYTGPTKETASDAKLNFGEGAVIKDDEELYNLKVKDLKVAPNSVYADANLNKANGTVYFIDFDVTSIKQNGAFRTSSINGLFLYPTFKSGEKAKRLYGDAPGCESESTTLAVGETGSSCYVYQISGPKATTVTYNDYSHNLVWSK